MSRLLNSKYFSTVDSKISNGFRYETVRSMFPGATMILVPNGDPSRPIAAVSFVPNEALDERRCDVVSALMPRDSVPQRFLPPYDTKGFNRYFQAMFNQGDREMAFVITNLVDGHGLGDRDYVKIDILKTLPEQLNLTDYRENGVNNVNEIRPSQSYAVRSDQTTNWRTMVLKGVCNAQGASMSVGQIDDALRRGEKLKKEENYFFINVVASSTQPEIASLLSNSTWIAADFFVRKISVYSGGMAKGRGYLSNDRLERNSVRSLSMMEEDLSMEDDDVAPRGSYESAFAQSLSLDSRGDRDRGSRGAATFSVAQSRSVQPMGARAIPSSNSWVPYSAAAAATPLSTQQAAYATGSDISQSQAGRVSVGHRQIEQVGNQTNAEYIHTSPGEKLVLCFSVWHGMRSVPSIEQDVLLRESKLLIKDAQSTEQLVLLKMLSKTFKSDDCCICYEPNPSMVLLRCTHQCLCKNCCAQFAKSSCPLCRQVVSQTLDAQQWIGLLK